MTYYYNNEMFKYDGCFLFYDAYDEEDKKLEELKQNEKLIKEGLV